MAVVTVAAIFFVMWMVVLKALGHPPTSTMQAFVGGLTVASTVWGSVLILLRFDGSLSWRLGADGEESTAAALQGLGAEWVVFHNVPFAIQGGGEIDVDHIAIGPFGVLVVESKWSTRPIDLSRRAPEPRVADAVRQAKGNAGRVWAVLRGIVPQELIVPAVVFWGRRVTGSPPDDARIDDVRVARGSDIADWPRRLAEVQNLTPDLRLRAADRLLQVMERHERARLARPEEVATTAALRGRSCRWALAGLMLGVGSAALLGATGRVEIRGGATHWLVPLVGALFGIVVPFLLLGSVVVSTVSGLRLRERQIEDWWRWPLVGLIGPSIYVALLGVLAASAR